ncbi:MAG: hypothetical protein VX641_07920 [Planctomycetota bacterium]|nr:hypothetical protein [Planctomycetota bacterium]
MGAAVRLSSTLGAPLSDDSIRAIVGASAQAIGERTGVQVRITDLDDASIELEVEGSPLEATALAAELRRVTNDWHRDKFGCALWSSP